MNNREAPKVFISHASEDKERFVIDFAKGLRSQGVNAWLDQWEIMPGDSLVNKIFEEGIGKADAVIIVLSHISIQKPWVREELDISVVQKINAQLRLIPVIIDPDCVVPIALRATKWIKISDLEVYEDELREIVNAVFGVSDKPPLGQPPRYIQLGIDQLPSLSSIDAQVFEAICESTLNDRAPMMNVNQFLKVIQGLEISDEDLDDSLHILHNRNLIEAKWFNERNVLPMVKLTTRGFENYGKFYIQDFDKLLEQTMLTIVNGSLMNNRGISDRLNISPSSGMFILDILSLRKYIKLWRFNGNIRESIIVQSVTAEGKRFVMNLR